MVWPRLRQIRRHRYSPMPLARVSRRPLRPVNPRSKIRGRSSGAMPMPVSRMHRSSPSMAMVTEPLAVYFRALDSTCSTTKSSHLASVTTVRSRG